MSLWSNLLKTYEVVQNAAGLPMYSSGSEIKVEDSLLPLYHTTLPVQITVTLDEHGNLIRIEMDKKPKEIIVPYTEKSMSRSSTALYPHPLCDQLKYLDRAVDSNKVGMYLEQLAAWKADNRYLNAIYHYVAEHSITEDARAFGIELPTKKNDKKSKTGVRFAVQIPEESNPHVEELPAIRDLWISYLQKANHQCGLDLFGADFFNNAESFPKKIVPTARNAKLISANDTRNFTFRGRFSSRDEALLIDATSSQKIHSTLNWLIRTHGSLTGSQAIVLWSIEDPDHTVEKPSTDSYDLLDSLLQDEDIRDPVQQALHETDVNYAKQFNRLIRGYGNAQILKQHHKKVVLVIFDAATTGRLSTTFYREFEKEDYLESVMRWHTDSAWPLSRYDKQNNSFIRYIGAPSYQDILRCSYGVVDDTDSESYRRFAKKTKQQLIECMFNGAQLPRTLLNSAFHRVTRPVSYGSDSKELNRWIRDFEVACSLWKKHFIDEMQRRGTIPSFEEKEKMMDLDESRTDRDYLFGRLLALADRFENGVLYRQGIADTRPTNAVKYMANFIAKPSSTWQALYKQLLPYILASNGAPYFQNSVDDIILKFKPGDFEDKSPLNPPFLLGYSAQRRFLMRGIRRSDEADPPREED